jgi:hypothetical protein
LANRQEDQLDLSRADAADTRDGEEERADQSSKRALARLRPAVDHDYGAEVIVVVRVPV